MSGTPTYMAPEQFEGEAATIAGDIYAVGLILFEICSGRRMVSGSSLKEILEQHRNDAPRESLKSAPEVDRAVAAVIEKCLARDPAARPKSARAVLAALPGGDALDAAVAAGETPSPAMVAAASEKGELAQQFPLTLDPSSWYFGRSLFALLAVAALALFAFWRSLGGKPLLPGPIFEE